VVATVLPLLTLDSPVSRIPGVRPRHVGLLARIGVQTVHDLLLHVPYDWESFGGVTPISRLRPGDRATVVGEVTSIQAKVARYKRIRLAEATVSDGTGVLKVTFFNQAFLAQKLPRGQRVALAGQVKGPRVEMVNPHLEVVGDDGGPALVGGLMPKYHTTEGLSSRKIAEFVAAVLPVARRLEEPIPDDILRRHHLMPIAAAIRAAHQPESSEDWQQASRRLVWEELFELQAAFVALRREQAVEKATAVPYRQEVIDTFKAGLGFELTHAQRRATWEIYQDMAKELPMNRLLDGDVGSGKTAVAAAAATMAHAAGLQTVVMAPTEILARQHLQKFRGYLEPSFPGLTVELLVSGQPAAERRRVLTAAASGHCAVLVGTHALIEDSVELANLGLAIVDEQHRFGTRQRELLRAKAGNGRPHFLAMTATPIPRTLALALYGEMAISIIDEMPPGRTPVGTAVLAPDARGQAYDLVRREVAVGHQAFVICPLIEESEKLEAKAAEVEFERLRTEVFPELRLALVHGRLKEKDAVMRAFRDREADILVATSVIEVGVDVPNATVMLIEGADRFGLAQLHQFRGRVGRGADQSYCVLLADDPSEGALTRLHLMQTIHDGFRLADQDMRMRGAGQLMGARQHGISDAAMRALGQPELLSEAREEAERILDADPGLERHPSLREAVRRRLQQTAIS
jgi:ATP-dependent DNA helicase RecG